MTNDPALRRNADLPPKAATTTPPNAPPRTVPTATPDARAAVARARSDSGTNITNNADDAGPNGAPTTVDAAANTTSWIAEWLYATATNTPAENRSEQTMTTRRSKRSPIAPAHGAASTDVANCVRTSAATQAPEPPLRLKMTATHAIEAARVPVTEIARATDS
jgi:hypothetical protein